MRGEARKKRRAAEGAANAEAIAEKKSDRAGTIVGVSSVVVVLLGMVAWTMLTNRFWSGDLRRVTLTSAGILATVAIEHVSEDGSSADFRVVVVDPRTGTRLARRIVGDFLTCEEVAVGNLWCRNEANEVRALKLPSLDDRATWADIRRAVPALAAGLVQDPIKVSGDALVVTANDGRPWSLRVDPLRGDEGVRGKAEELRVPAMRTWTLPVSTGSLDVVSSRSGARKAVVLRPAGSPQVTEASATGCTETYLGADFVVFRGPPGSTPSSTLQDPEGGILIHETSLDHAASRTLVSRIGLDGCSLWTHDLGKGKLELATAGTGVLTIVGDLPNAVVIGLDLASGRERWRRDL